ncbi:hypothetical protein [Pseudomonas sp.]|uniref:hypothetical protein n=1 Tax=Pseudomonas sp. TaxID=306 RepID=UPI002628B724|nr:hypothetical protein [Pseudomonas sp.]
MNPRQIQETKSLFAAKNRTAREVSDAANLLHGRLQQWDSNSGFNGKNRPIVVLLFS